eukprot:15191128-Alexandrium_andersonii.AAC.1
MPTGLDAVVSSDDEVPPELLLPVPPGFDSVGSSLLERDLAEVVDADVAGAAGQPVRPATTGEMLGSARALSVGDQLN